MDISELVVMLTFLCIPGIVFIFLEQKALYRSEKSDITLILKAIVFGFISYFVLGMIYTCLNNLSLLIKEWNINLEVNFFKFLENLGNQDKSKFIDVYEIVWASCVAFILSCIKISISNTLSEIRTFSNNGIFDKGKEKNINGIKKFIAKSFAICKSLNLIGDQIANDSDVWNYILTNNNIVIMVTDEVNKKSYMGKVIFNGNGNINGIRELYLEKALITDLESGFSEMVESYYLSRPVEFPWNIEFFPIQQGELTQEKEQELMKNRKASPEDWEITENQEFGHKKTLKGFKKLILENKMNQIMEIKEKSILKLFEDPIRKLVNWLKRFRK